jgi:hypothetical protein
MFYRWCDLYKCKRPTVAELKQPQNNMMWSTEVQSSICFQYVQSSILLVAIKYMLSVCNFKKILKYYMY